jgi:hypothetical protein
MIFDLDISTSPPLIQEDFHFHLQEEEATLFHAPIRPIS